MTMIWERIANPTLVYLDYLESDGAFRRLEDKTVWMLNTLVNAGSARGGIVKD